MSLCMDSIAKFKSPANVSFTFWEFVRTSVILKKTGIQSHDCTFFSFCLCNIICSTVFNMGLSFIFMAKDLIFLIFLISPILLFFVSTVQHGNPVTHTCILIVNSGKDGKYKCSNG